LRLPDLFAWSVAGRQLRADFSQFLAQQRPRSSASARAASTVACAPALEAHHVVELDRNRGLPQRAHLLGDLGRDFWQRRPALLSVASLDM